MPPTSGNISKIKVHQLDFAAYCYQWSDDHIDITSGILRCAGQFSPGIRPPRQGDLDALLALTGWPNPNSPLSVTVADPICTETGTHSTFAMLQGKAAETFLDQQGFKYWCYR